MTGYSLKGSITFLLIVLALVVAVVSGAWSEAGTLLLMLLVGMVFYQVGRFFIRGLTGWDPHEGTTARDRVARTRTTSRDTRKDTLSSSLYNPFKCPYCRRSFKVKSALDQHISDKHDLKGDSR